MNKKFLSAILFGALMVSSTGTFVSCKDYDDDIEQINTELADLKSKIADLQNAVNNGDYVTAVAKTADGKGMTFTFSKGKTITVALDVKDGADGKPGAPGKDAQQVTVDAKTGELMIDGKGTGIFPAKDAAKAPVKMEGGYWYALNEKGEYVDTKIPVSGLTVVGSKAEGFTLTVFDKDGKSQAIKLPTAASLLTELDLMGWSTKTAADKFSMADLKDAATVLDVKYKYLANIVLKYASDKKVNSWSAQKDVVKNQVLTTLSPLNHKLVARIAPASVDWADFSFTLQDSKGGQLPISLGTAEAFKGILTKANAASTIGFISMDVVADTYANATEYANLFNANALYSLVEASGYRSTYGLTVTATEAGTIAEQKVVAVDPAGTTATENKGNGKETNPFVVDLNTPTRLVFGEKPEFVYDYYVEPKDEKVAKEFGFSTDKKAGTITLTKASDLVSKAGLELNVYALHIDGSVYRSSVWVKPSSILATGVVLKAGEKTIAPILDNQGNIVEATKNQTVFTVSLDEMFAKMSETDKNRWQSTVMGANGGAKLAEITANGIGLEEATYGVDMKFVDAKGKNTTCDKATALKVFVNYKDAEKNQLLNPETEYALTVNFMHDEEVGQSVLNTVKVTFTPVLPELSTFLAKKTGYWKENTLMAYFDDPTSAEQNAKKVLASEFDIMKGYSTFGLKDNNGGNIAEVALNLDNNQKLSDKKPILHQGEAAAAITGSTIKLTTKTIVEGKKVSARAYNENLNVYVGVTYLDVYDYTETATYKKMLEEAGFQINVQSALIAGTIKALEGTSIVMTPAAAGEVWKLTADHVSGYTYSNNQSTPYNIFKDWTVVDAQGTEGAKFKYTYIQDVVFSSADTDYYVVTDIVGDAVAGNAGKAIDPKKGEDGKVVASYLPLKSVNTTEKINTKLHIEVTDMYGYSKVFKVDLQINPASK